MKICQSHEFLQPKYVTNLLKTAEKRQQEYEAREERKQMAEREKEAGEFDDREVCENVPDFDEI